MSTSFHLAQLDELDPVACPCGSSARAFVDLPSSPASVHLLRVSTDARAHYHRRMTETYAVLEGEGRLYLDDRWVPLRPLTTVMIPPGTRHRAEGDLKVLVLVVPSFDPDDEWFD